MGFSSCHKIHFSAFVLFFLLFSLIFPTNGFNDFRQENKTFVSSKEQYKMNLINAYLKKVNKPYVKSIKSPDGDIIDCVLIHLQPAFDLPEIKRTFRVNIKPKIPKGHKNAGLESEIKQLWNLNGESCPYGTIPIRRTSASDIIRSGSIPRFGKKKKSSKVNIHEGHKYAIGSVSNEGNGDFYGAKAGLNIWKPNVSSPNDFSVSQIWVAHRSLDKFLNTIEAGWHVYPKMYKNNSTRIFIYWTPDEYLSGCYNLLCPGFVQTNSRFSFGAAIHPISKYNGKQFTVAILIWKDGLNGDWWLCVGKEIVDRNILGYWPASLFPNLRHNATLIEYGGEVYSEDTEHTSTQMGNGHLPKEGRRKAACVRNLEVVDKENLLNPVSDLDLDSNNPSCYDVISGFDEVLGKYILFGGPGKSRNCTVQNSKSRFFKT